MFSRSLGISSSAFVLGAIGLYVCARRHTYGRIGLCHTPADRQNALPQLLTDDALVHIAMYDYRIYGSMLVVNKTMNELLKRFDPWTLFVEFVESSYTESASYPPSDVSVRMLRIRGTCTWNNVNGIRHGEYVEVKSRRRNGARPIKTEKRQYYKLGRLYRQETWNYVYSAGAGEYKWKGSEYVYTNAMHKIRYVYGRDGNVLSKTYYRKDKEYSPCLEIAQVCVGVVGWTAIVSIVGYNVWIARDAILPKLAAYLRGDIWTLWQDIKWIVLALGELQTSVPARMVVESANERK